MTPTVSLVQFYSFDVPERFLVKKAPSQLFTDKFKHVKQLLFQGLANNEGLAMTGRGMSLDLATFICNMNLQ